MIDYNKLLSIASSHLELIESFNYVDDKYIEIFCYYRNDLALKRQKIVIRFHDFVEIANIDCDATLSIIRNIASYHED